MTAITVLRRGWKETLASVVKEAEDHLLICSPYVSCHGTDFINSCLSRKLRESGRLTFVTNLSPVNVAQGSTDPNSLYALSGVVPRFAVMHLPRLHAKVYVSDTKRAVITSGNLTLLWDGEPLTWEDSDDRFLSAKDGNRYQKNFDFLVDGKRVYGWVGILARGSREDAGFSIIHCGRVVIGYPDSWRPSTLYGQYQGTNDLVNQRLVGEIDSNLIRRQPHEG